MIRERVAIRGGNCNNGAQCPGALNLNNAPSNANWNIGARAALTTGRSRPLTEGRPVHDEHGS